MTSASLPPVANAEYITDALRRTGRLGGGRVSDVKIISSRDSIVSHFFRLGLTYDGAAADAPGTMILKIAHANFAERLWNGGRHEVAFYTEVGPLMPPRVVPQCFDGHCDAEARTWHLLLEDLTDSHHVATVWPLPPCKEQSLSIVGALARMHAAWWDHPRLGNSVGNWLSGDELTSIVQQFAGHLARFSDQFGDLLSAERRELYRRFLDAAPRLTQRYHSHRNITMTHGDAHIWNFLMPHEPTRDNVRVIDFDQWRINVGSNDLAYMMALQWYPDRRQHVEQMLLDHYHETLLSHGVVGYDRAALNDDYRRSVLWHITVPIWQWTAGIPPLIWWNNLERVLLAADDLDCLELLD